VRFYTGNIFISCYYPLLASPTPPQPTEPAEPSLFFQKRGTPFFADRPPGSSYQPRRVESKGAAGNPRQPITLRFVGYPTFAGRPCGWGAASIPPQRRWGKIGVKVGYCRHWVIFLAPIDPPVCESQSPSTEQAGV